jgi:hypothetical protein
VVLTYFLMEKLGVSGWPFYFLLALLLEYLSPLSIEIRKYNSCLSS